MTHRHEWHSAVTQGRELLHVYWGAKEIIVKYSESKKRTPINCRHGMALWYAFEIFYRDEWRRLH